MVAVEDSVEVADSVAAVSGAEVPQLKQLKPPLW